MNGRDATEHLLTRRRATPSLDLAANAASHNSRSTCSFDLSHITYLIHPQTPAYMPQSPPQTLAKPKSCPQPCSSRTCTATPPNRAPAPEPQPPWWYDPRPPFPSSPQNDLPPLSLPYACQASGATPEVQKVSVVSWPNRVCSKCRWLLPQRLLLISFLPL